MEIVTNLVSLRKAFENVKKTATKASEAQAEFSHAINDSKYSELDELPDEIVDVTDYGQANMTYEEFKEKMDEALEKQKDGD
jgi:spore germination cell wall hydrolase CwlJ-like protein